MSKYIIITSEEFNRDFVRLDRQLQEQMQKLLAQLEKNPFIGKPLGYVFFREKKLGKYRIYYLIYEEYVAVFIIAMSDKKSQQKTITLIKSLIPYYREEIKKRLMR